MLKTPDYNPFKCHHSSSFLIRCDVLKFNVNITKSVKLVDFFISASKACFISDPRPGASLLMM